MTKTTEIYYIAKYVQFNLEDQTRIFLHAEDQYYTNKNIARFNFLNNEGWYYTIEGKKIEVKRFSTIMNYFFKINENFGWDSKLVEQAKENAKQIKLEESKQYEIELKNKSEEKAIHFMNEFLTSEQAAKLQVMEIEELKKMIKNTFKYASKKTLKLVLDTILNFDVLELNKPIEENENNDITYTVGNRTFYSYGLALDYCNSNDFDPSTMIIKEVVQQQPFEFENGTIYNFNHNSKDLSQYDHEKDISKHNAMYSTLKDRDYISKDQLIKLIDNNYNFRMKILNDKPYKKSQYVLIDLTLKYFIKPITLYLNREGLGDILKVA